MKNKSVRPLNNRTLPLNVETQIVQDICVAVIEKDSRFCKSYKTLRDQFTSGAVAAHVFTNTVRWLVGDSLRRNGVPLKQARMFDSNVMGVQL